MKNIELSYIFVYRYSITVNSPDSTSLLLSRKGGKKKLFLPNHQKSHNRQHQCKIFIRDQICVAPKIEYACFPLTA